MGFRMTGKEEKDVPFGDGDLRLPAVLVTLIARPGIVVRDGEGKSESEEV